MEFLNLKNFIFKKKIYFNVFLGVWILKNKDLSFNKYLIFNRNNWQIFYFKELFFIFILLEYLLSKIKIKKQTLMFICTDDYFKKKFKKIILGIKQYYVVEWIDGLISNNWQILHFFKLDYVKIKACTNFINNKKVPKFLFLLSLDSELRKKFFIEAGNENIPVFSIIFVEEDLSSDESYYIIGNCYSFHFLYFFIKTISNFKCLGIEK